MGVTWTAVRNPADPGFRRFTFTMALIGWCYPAVVLSAPYVAWIVTGLALGHLPRPHFDDPYYISPVITRICEGALVTVATAPARIAWGLACSILFGVNRRLHVLAILGLILILLGLWAGTGLLLRWDPLRVMKWMLD